MLESVAETDRDKSILNRYKDHLSKIENNRAEIERLKEERRKAEKNKQKKAKYKKGKTDFRFAFFDFVDKI